MLTHSFFDRINDSGEKSGSRPHLAGHILPVMNDIQQVLIDGRFDKF